MVSNFEAIEKAQKSVALKVEEPEVDADRPWEDDLLNRHEIATRLTNLVANQEAPLTVSLHGQWGTGKTFMLRRWQKDLESGDQPYRAIYFNAWEDDFCDDPLLAFIGQLSEYFGKAGQGSLLEQTVQKALPLIRENLTGIFRATTGVSIDLNQLAQRDKSLLEVYQEQRATKDELKKELASLAKKVAEETGHPLVFIVDELDRCRPTFAIELLERVKHIFDVPSIVFVFGLNRDELCKSLTSVYGDIDADVYLRRFFDFEFNLPEADPIKYCQHLVARFQLDQWALTLRGVRVKSTAWDHPNVVGVPAMLWNALDFSLRDIDYGIRLIALLVRSAPADLPPNDYLLSLLIGFKFKNPEIYRSLISGRFRTGDIIDYLISEAGAQLNGRDFVAHLDWIEGFLYCVDETNDRRHDPGNEAIAEIDGLLKGEHPREFRVLSKRLQHADERNLRRVHQIIRDMRFEGMENSVFGHLARFIDTYQAELRR